MKNLSINATLTPRLNLAFHQNSVPTLREVTIVNDSDTPLQTLTLTLSSSPPFFKSKTWHIDAIGPKQQCHLPELDVRLDAALLGRLTEAEKAEACFRLQSGEEEIARLEVPIELLARNQWGGIGDMPEMVAAFVQPNDPAVDRLLKKAAQILREHGKDSKLSGYLEGGAKRAWELAAAIWSAVASMGLDYALPPASFEQAGQKIRSPSQIEESGLATCLDSTLLFCAVLEQCGLNPLIVFTQGHAFVGVWLKAEEFSTVVVDDITALRKRVQLKELALFETTLVTNKPCPTFARATELGAQNISDGQEAAFELAVDLRRARLQRIRPLAATEAATSAESALPHETAEPSTPAFEEAPDLPDESIVPDNPSEKPSTPQGRLDRWQRKLLDLSLRNNLLNFKASKRALRLDAPDPGRLEDLLADGKELRLLPRPDLMEGADPRSQALHEARTDENLRRQHALDALERNEIFVALEQKELDARLVDLYRSARSALQEGGANTLFLALGFLSWTREDKDDKKFRAPLILIPVTLKRKSVRSGFSLVLHEDEPRFNPTLLEMLRQDFKLALPVIEGELPKDESGLDINGIWRTVAQAIKDIRGWEVATEIVLSTFSFAKYLMWKDLAERSAQLKNNPVVRHLIDTPRDPYRNDVPFPNPRALDAIYTPAQTFCPLPTDSSQLSAVMAAAKGKDFVLVGPPGTGKSQTIANLIAQCLAEKKTVLFVAEKIAALDVVYRRLREVGLGEFCLELHSSKASKLAVLGQLGKAWMAKGVVDAEQWRQEAQRLKNLREQLNEFVEHQHRRHRNGLSAFQAVGRIAASQDIPKLELSWPSVDAHDAAALDHLRELADRLDVDAQAVGSIADNPLSLIAQGEWSPSWQQALLHAANELRAAIEPLEQSAAAFCQSAGFPHLALDTPTRQGLATLAKLLPQAAGKDWRFVLQPNAKSIRERLQQGMALVLQYQNRFAQLPTPWSADVIALLKQGLERLKQYRAIYGELSVAYHEKATDLDARQLQADWKKAQQSWWPMNWLRRRAVHATLKKVSNDPNPPDIAADIERFVQLQKLAADIAAMERLRTETHALWVGLETDPERIDAAIAFQRVLSSALAHQPWQEEKLAAVADGRCGKAMATGLSHLRELRALEQQIDEFHDLQSETGGLWQGWRSKPEAVEQALRFQMELQTCLHGFVRTADTLFALKTALIHLLGEGNTLLESGAFVAAQGETYGSAETRFRQKRDQFAQQSKRTPDEILSFAKDSPAALATICRQILETESRLRAWCAWRKARKEAITLGLHPLVSGIESGIVAPGQVRRVFEAEYCRWWLAKLVDGDPILREFVSVEHEKRIADFRALDDRFTQLSRAFIRSELCAELPDQDSVTKNSEWGLLRHEMQKKKRHLPLRELMQRLPNTVTKLTPCLLMSPLSIAQYLSSESAVFDVVVFDEASQIPVWDAIGAMARGKQVVMVGDPKQMPPTNFFMKAESNADDEDVEDDLESILDECLGANLPTLDLNWHYRSRHESLIAFSNHRYYGGGLVTFPSPLTEDRAVSFHGVVNGVYERSGAPTNQPEARALVSDVVQRLKDPQFKASGLTLGIVTFNMKQQRLIEDLLDEARRTSPAIEAYFAEDALEPLFVKNLESVQGDERDIIYFSITYGPDRSGAVSMNFGPLNKDGGQRRLNVAITRARHEMRVFSSLKSEQIDLSRTQAVGVRDLKHFLEFAERGARALGEAVFGTIGDYDSLFEQAVATALADKGWQVHPQVGVSSFRIDLGIVDPDAPGRYLAGVECDGATYHRSATARDRDKLREQVLRGLGWEILRIWSTDWWIDAKGTLEKLHAKLEALAEQNRARRAEAAAQKTLPPEPVPTDEIAAEALPQTDAMPELIAGNPPSNSPELAFDNTEIAGHPQADPDRFYESNYDDVLTEMIAQIMQAEAPIKDDVLARRIARLHGWKRTGKQIQDRVLKIARRSYPTSEEKNGALFFWRPGADTRRCETFRQTVADGETRSVDEIALPELAVLAREAQAQGLHTEDEVIAYMKQAIGISRIGESTRTRLVLAWNSLSC